MNTQSRNSDVISVGSEQVCILRYLKAAIVDSTHINKADFAVHLSPALFFDLLLQDNCDVLRKQALEDNEKNERLNDGIDDQGPMT